MEVYTMSDYINRADAIEKINIALKRVFIVEVGRDILASIPPADVVPVIRCKDCRRWHDNGTITGFCEKLGWFCTEFNFYCFFAERKEDETI
jgi:hypothetical protein